MKCRVAGIKDIDEVLKLQSKYHVSTIKDEDRTDGFVTTLFTESQLQKLVLKEKGLFLLIHEQKVVGYVMAGSWDYWKYWPMFRHMIDGLENLQFSGQSLNTENTYQYGPICIDKIFRGTGALEKLFDFARAEMAPKYPILITFVNKANPRSVEAHERKLGLQTIQEFDYNGNTYLEMAYETSRAIIL